MNFKVEVTNKNHISFAETICAEIEQSAKIRGTGIAKRDPEYIKLKIQEGKAVIAFAQNNEWAGFSYIEVWEHENYVVNSGLIVAPQFRKTGLAKAIKKKIFELSRQKYPQAKVFGLTTGLAVMKINSDLGYEPVTYSELTSDMEFWAGCKSCINYDILTQKKYSNCLCTAMLFNPENEKKNKTKAAILKRLNLWKEKFLSFKKSVE
ncbi:MAG: GNAT family N-acetyltransferase [Sediminibacterium sp.]|nr:GNAT family N-acetyltransferase [Sediminibacterium sp.]